MKFIFATLMFLVLTSISVAQNKTSITYHLEVNFGPEAVESLIKDVQEKSENQPDSIMAFLSQMKELLGVLNKSKQHLLVYRRGDEVVMTELSTTAKVYKHYNTKTLEFTVIDSSTYRKINKVDTFRTSLNYKSNPNWNVHYNVKQLKKRKSILGFNCSLFIIEESKQIKGEQMEKRTFSVWCTKKIKPPFGIHAILGLYDKILDKYTPLEVEQKSSEIDNSYQILKAVKIY